MAEAMEAPIDGRRLKALRERAGLTQAQAARAAGLSRSALATAEQGRSRLGGEVLARLLAVYDGAGARGRPVGGAAGAGRRQAPSRAAPRQAPTAPAGGGCPHDRAVVDAMTAEGMACRCLACGAAFVEPWRR
jgi:hypothetical protein